MRPGFPDLLPLSGEISSDRPYSWLECQSSGECVSLERDDQQVLRLAYNVTIALANAAVTEILKVATRYEMATTVLTLQVDRVYTSARRSEMATLSIKHQLNDFVEFASRRIETGSEVSSLEELFQQWRNDPEYSEAVDDVRQGIADVANGLAEPVAKVFSDIRRQLGIVD